MSLLPAFFGRKPAPDDQAPAVEPDDQARTDIFNLIPPRADERYQRPELNEPVSPPQQQGRDVHAVNAMDLTRLSIDNDGRLYWDGKPVEVQRRILLSRTQALASGLIAAFIVIGALGSAIQASAVVHDWACRNGLATDCAAPAPAVTPMPAPQPRVDIPA